MPTEKLSDDLPIRRWYDEQQPMQQFMENLFSFEPPHRNIVGESLGTLARTRYHKFIEREGTSFSKGRVMSYAQSFNKRRRYDRVQGLHKAMLTHSLLPEPKQHEMGEDFCQLTELVKDYANACHFHGFRENTEHIANISRLYSQVNADEARRLVLALKHNLKRLAADQVRGGTKLAPNMDKP